MIDLSLLPVATLRIIESALRAHIKFAHDKGEDAPQHREALGKVGDEIDARVQGIAPSAYPWDRLPAGGEGMKPGTMLRPVGWSKSTAPA